MALINPITTKYGTPAEYWKVESIYINNITQVARITLSGYVDENTRSQNLEPIEKLNYNIAPVDYDKYFSVNVLEEKNPIAIVYEFIKQQDIKFENSLDI